MRFRATPQLAGKTATGFEVPDEIVEKLGMGEVYVLSVSAEHRAGAGVAARKAFDAFAYSHQRRWVPSVEDSRTDATRGAA